MKRILITSIIIGVVLMLSGCAIAAEKKVVEPVVQSAETQVMLIELQKQLNSKVKERNIASAEKMKASVTWMAMDKLIEQINADITQLQNRAKLLITPPKVEKGKKK